MRGRVSQVNPKSPRSVFEKLEFTWSWYANPYFEKKPVCQATKQDGFPTNRCELSNTSTTKGIIDTGRMHLGEKEPNRFYEKNVLVDGKPYTIQALWRVAEIDWWFDTSYYDLKIFNAEGALIALVSEWNESWRGGQVLKGSPDFIRQAVNALCPQTKKIQFKAVENETCEDLPPPVVKLTSQGSRTCRD
ncbi:MAG: hypothetical protein A3F82_00400 [Deltaproteobacteria bacterium RIFCSPLOWO2_12_FULL_44_12]|nr:MAG: hypothetical protein A2712_04555 [Deltaproteobacteria bacterium RIFCSPHIGHO2_01_FULL_43_49]OGQ16450.1 MAG: hypothetical protein A3D22_02520 [Deltaproteobacteria bacterium RIFCSPHIGHO2_02_FULL_44_53]OGQ27722.1 MAG: hypothetical protein A3D98_08465 [Deltaproteobacteria bacterium RIFCSPHIGHO2_12_FULL_44_21]OGQ32968.1 MAG: hypothetical protein A2979_10450 [Deltaproteobacteria bacterium RIFCSPLOWO2_01_FULL_45_74]OGQ42070.1 MAG: hypothetical protein A3I70_10240 [Deltaproteobacteria bacterium 